MLEISKKQLLSFDEKNRAIILKYIALGIIKYKQTNKSRSGEDVNERKIKRYVK